MPCIRVCKGTFNTGNCPDCINCEQKSYNKFGELRKFWEAWDLRILVLYILFAQLYLLFFGRHRRKSKSWVMMIVSVWLLYLFSDLLATIALGKLSKIKVDNAPNSKAPSSAVSMVGSSFTTSFRKKAKNANMTISPNSLRILWAPVILFCLGGPDTMTVLRAEENQLWVRHLIGLLTQGLRAGYVLLITWKGVSGLSVLALLVLIPGIIKYAERVWVIKSRGADNYEVQSHEFTINTMSSTPQRNTKLVLQAYSWFQCLKPHNSEYEVNRITVATKVAKFRRSVTEGTVGGNLDRRGTTVKNAFQLIEIELGFLYDMVFSKVGTFFTVWGSILRVISLSFLVSVLVVFFLVKKPENDEYLKVDLPITIILLVGVLFLEIGGIGVQLASDWALIWAYKQPSKWATPVRRLHEFLIPERKRWSGQMGQFSFRNFCTKYEPTMWNRMMMTLFGKEKMLKGFSSNVSPDETIVKELIIIQLRDKPENGADAGTLQASGKKVTDDILQTPSTSATSTKKVADSGPLQTLAEKVLDRDTSQIAGDQNVPEVDRLPTSTVKVADGLGFHQRIVVWHVATEIFHSEDGRMVDTVEVKATKTLSDYMMYLLLICPNKFPFSNKYVYFMKRYPAVKELFGLGQLKTSNPQEQDTGNITLVNNIQQLAQELRGKPDRWKIISNEWVEMLCHAASQCPVKNHIQELRNGGEFLTHVWLLRMHFGQAKKLERSSDSLINNEDDPDDKYDNLGDGLDGLDLF